MRRRKTAFIFALAGYAVGNTRDDTTAWAAFKFVCMIALFTLAWRDSSGDPAGGIHVGHGSGSNDSTVQPAVTGAPQNCCEGTGLLTDGVTSCPVCTLVERRTAGKPGLFASTERSRPAPSLWRRFRAALPHELDGRVKKTDIPVYIARVAELELVQGELRKRLAYAVELMEQRPLSKDEQDFVDHLREDGWI